MPTTWVREVQYREFIPNYMADKAVGREYSLPRQADALLPVPARGDLGGQASQEFFEGAERLRDDLREIRERWDNRLILEETPFAKGYFDGRFEIVLHGNRRVEADEINWFCPIPASAAVFKESVSRSDVDVIYSEDGDGRQNKVVFVDIVQIGDSPKIAIPVAVPVRLYRIPDKDCSVGHGLLYRNVSTLGFKVFPFSRDWEGNGSIVNGSRCLGDERGRAMVECGSKVVNRIAYDQGKEIWEWLFGDVAQVKTIGMRQDCFRAGALHSDFVKLTGQGGRVADKAINVAVGPFDL